MKKIDQIKKELTLINGALRNSSQLVEELLTIMEELAPTNDIPRKRKNLKEERFNKYYQKIK